MLAHANDSDPTSPAYRGSDWGNTVMAPGTAIPSQAALFLVGSEGDPGTAESDHWGWIYYSNTVTQQKMQVYLQLNRKNGIVEYGVSNFDKDSSESHPYGQNAKFENSRTFFCGVVNGTVVIIFGR
ncbi:MAG TPA: hypothetical protein VN253_27140 [Kofleriaceae bacterium]|nr:hypothetical protein [Kofleriaceae bacterium]